MKRAVFSAFLVCSLGLACGSKHGDPGNQPASMAGSGAVPSAGSSGAAGQPGGQSGGGEAHDNGGGLNGGAAGGGAAGSVDGGAAGHAGMSNGGSGNPGAGGQTALPQWANECSSVRAEVCDGCISPECAVCLYGTDAERASTGVRCDDRLKDYKEYCNCHVSGCPVYCRPEYE